jgi:hypothetical protein
MKSVLVMITMLAFIAQTAFATVETGGASDPSLSVVIVGKWAEKAGNFALSLSGVTQYFADGAARMDATASVLGKKFEIVVKGFWKIVGRRLTMTATQSSHPRLFPPGTETNDEIVSISSTQMILLDENGKREVCERVK